MRRTLMAAGLVIGGLLAQTHTARSTTPSDTGSPQTGAQPGGAALTHSAAKATTFNITVMLTNLVIFSAGTGSVVGGGVLTAFNITKSLFLFTANDYVWDTYFPNDTRQDGNREFDTSQSLWRTTEKFLTYKPISAAIKFASIFVYTGSVPIMIAYGTASEVVNAGVFYLNDFTWGLYDWSSQANGDEDPQGPPPLKLGRLQPVVSP